MTDNLSNLFDVTPEDEVVTEETTVVDEVPTTEPKVEEEVVVDEVPAEGEQKTDKTPAVEEPVAPKDKTGDADEVSQLRIILREQNRRLREMQQQLEKSNKSLTEKGLIEEPDEEEVAEAQKADTIRAIQLETLLETMRINPKFEDVDEVVTQSRFDDMVEGFAFAQSQKNGGTAEDYIDAVAAKIWSMPNPYRFMYEKIKQYHPDFKKPEVKDEPSTPAPSQTPAKSEPKPKTAPPSVSNLPSSVSESGGWTAARIDGMAEEELSKVPRDIYQKYLSGELK
jgi:hypothetical protein